MGRSLHIRVVIPAAQDSPRCTSFGKLFQSNRRGELTVCPSIGGRLRPCRGQQLTCAGYIHSRDIGTIICRRSTFSNMVLYLIRCAEIYLQYTATKSGDVIHRVGPGSGHAVASVLAAQQFGVNALEHIAFGRGQNQVGAVVVLIGEIDGDFAVIHLEHKVLGPRGPDSQILRDILRSRDRYWASIQEDLNGDICAVMLRAAGVIVDQRVRFCCNNRTCTRGRFTVIGTAGIIVGRSINLDCGILIRQTPVKDVFVVIGKLIRRRSSFGIFFTIQHRLGGQASHLNSLGRYLKPLCLSLSAPFLDIGQNSIAV